MLPIVAPLNHIRRMINTNFVAEVYTIQLDELTSIPPSLLELPKDMEPKLQLLLHTYSKVFSIPTSLPPTREHDHSIPLMEGSGPIKVRPYRYPHSQKVEIEKLVDGML